MKSALYRLYRKMKDQWIATKSGPAIEIGTVQNLFNRVTLDVCCQSNAGRINFAANVSFDPGDTFDPDHTTPVGAKKIDEYVFKKWLKTDNLCQPLKARKK